MTALGFVGLGLMGRAMAANLVAAGHPLTVWNRTASRVSGLDVVVAASPAAVGMTCDIVFLCVSDTPDVEEVVFGESGIIHGLRSGAMVVDHSTISPVATAEFFERAAVSGVGWVDAPVSGGSEGAARGTLAIMAGGPAELVNRARPFMSAYSSSVVHVGEKPGSGQMVKSLNQILVVLNQLGVSEAFALGRAADIDLRRALSAIEGGAAGSWMLSNRGPQMLDGHWAPGFTIDLQQKDLRIALETAAELGVDTPGTRLVHELYRTLQERGLGGEGNHALIKALEDG